MMEEEDPGSQPRTGGQARRTGSSEGQNQRARGAQKGRKGHSRAFHYSREPSMLHPFACLHAFMCVWIPMP